MTQDLSKLLLATVILGVVIAGIFLAGKYLFFSQPKISPEQNILPPEKAAQKAIDFINQNKEMFGIEGAEASLVSVNEENGVYKFKLKIGEKEYDSYVTKNGKLLFVGGIDLDAKIPEPGEIPKSDRPDVKIFVMSYCPFGLQAQKMFLPVYDLLKEKVDFGIYFVSYLMHGREEMEENLRQYCIQKEEKEKYRDYLGCFVKEGKFAECLKEAKVNEERLKICTQETDKIFKISEQFTKEGYPPFDVHKELNEKYGVRGSPTIVINNSVVVQNRQYCPGGDIACTVIPDFDRSPEKFKQIICQAFNSPPPECNQKLSESQFSPGFGLEVGGSGGGQCQ